MASLELVRKVQVPLPEGQTVAFDFDEGDDSSTDPVVRFSLDGKKCFFLVMPDAEDAYDAEAMEELGWKKAGYTAITCSIGLEDGVAIAPGSHIFSAPMSPCGKYASVRCASVYTNMKTGKEVNMADNLYEYDDCLDYTPGWSHGGVTDVQERLFIAKLKKYFSKKWCEANPAGSSPSDEYWFKSPARVHANPLPKDEANLREIVAANYQAQANGDDDDEDEDEMIPAQVVCSFPEGEDEHTKLPFGWSPDSTLLARRCEDGRVQVMSVPSGELDVTLPDGPEGKSVAISPNNKLLLCGGAVKFAVFDLESKSKIGEIAMAGLGAFSADGKQICINTGDALHIFAI